MASATITPGAPVDGAIATVPGPGRRSTARLATAALVVLGGFVLVAAVTLMALIVGADSEGTIGGLTPGDIDPRGAVVDTTAPAFVEQVLAVSMPQAGELVTSPLVIEGNTTASQIGYRLFGAGTPLAEGSIVPEPDGAFSQALEFTNTCCIEMTLEVFSLHPDDGIGLTIPLTYPEQS